VAPPGSTIRAVPALRRLALSLVLGLVLGPVPAPAPGTAQVPGDDAPEQELPCNALCRWMLGRPAEPPVPGAAGPGEAALHAPGVGTFYGTREALAGLTSTLPEAPGPNRGVEPCRRYVEREARRMGAVQVEAASAGPERRAEVGLAAPVRVRVLYGRPDGYEVREAALTCILDRRGRVTSLAPAG
jgi:hypothetical protein